MLLDDRALLFMVATIVFLTIFYVLYVAFSLAPTDLQVATRYTSFGETGLYRSKWYYLIGFIIVAIAIAISHAGIMVKLAARGVRPMAVAFGWLTLGLIGIMFVVTWQVLSSAFLS